MAKKNKSVARKITVKRKDAQSTTDVPSSLEPEDIRMNIQTAQSVVIVPNGDVLTPAELLDRQEEANLVVQVSTNEAMPVLTEGQKIWEEIRHLPMQMFGLPFKRISEYCTQVNLVPKSCFLIPSSAAVLPMLEMALHETCRDKSGNDLFRCENQGRYIMVSRNV